MLFKELRFRFEIIEAPHSVCCVLKTCFITSDIIYNSRFRTEIDTNRSQKYQEAVVLLGTLIRTLSE